MLRRQRRPADGAGHDGAADPRRDRQLRRHFCEGRDRPADRVTDLAAYDDWLARWLLPEAQDAATPEPPDDTQAPRVRAVAARGAFGKRIALQFTVADDSGTARVAVTVRAPGVVLRRMYSGGLVPAAAAFPLTAAWQAPGAARKGLTSAWRRSTAPAIAPRARARRSALRATARRSTTGRSTARRQAWNERPRSAASTTRRSPWTARPTR